MLSGACEPWNAIVGSIFLSHKEVVKGGIVAGVWTVWAACPGTMWLYFPHTICIHFLPVGCAVCELSGLWGHVFLIYYDFTQSTHIFMQIKCVFSGFVHQVLFFWLWGKSHSCAQLSWLYAFLFYWQLLPSGKIDQWGKMRLLDQRSFFHASVPIFLSLNSISEGSYRKWLLWSM